jgi:hypothetical protein
MIGPKHAAAAERRYELPCDVTSFAQSGDGTVIWVACQDQSARKQWQRDAVQARSKGVSPPPPPTTYHSQTLVYALDAHSGQVQQVEKAQGPIYIIAAPVGTKSILILPQDSPRPPCPL